MKHLRKTFALLSAITLMLSAMAGCSQKKDEVECPFTTITWENTLEDVLALEGEPDNSYDSTYGGMTYVFDGKEYNGWNGSIKYLFDGEDKLVSMAWLYIPEDNDDRDAVYNALYKQTEKWYGDTGFESNQNSAKGAVWYLEGGNIIIGVMSTGVTECIQYQYFHPDVSSDGPMHESK